MTASEFEGATDRPPQSGTTFSYVDVAPGRFPDQRCEICAARPSVIRVCRWRCPRARVRTCPEPMEGEAHYFCAAHLLLADALSRRLSDT
jgi:hypothetical protein